MDCRIIECEQPSDLWDSLRRGRITASRVGDVLAKPETKRYKDYQKELTLELLGHVAVEKSPEWFAHGRAMEPAGLYYAAEKYGWVLDRNVFLVHKTHDWLGCSPDSLLVENGHYVGGVEMKARKLYKNYREAIARAHKYADTDRTKMVDPVYAPQIQTQMLISGMDHWWYLNYYEVRNRFGHPTGDYKLGRCPIPRDPIMCERIEERCMNFMHEVYENACLEAA